ncbi:TonB-dependent receptor [uncultured Shewanella sp.]|uniref:TonB-dependent receptor plug domain-containing protein n=1 Tax=uncultured Shewanella sp. TaxID=173975 RepID=UPI0026291459|nr:TonB-dependent receptor [uncultured Shewanella sp.]
MHSLTLAAKAVRRSCLAMAATSVVLSGQTFAEETTIEEKVERISVTGSRIKRTDMETASPVTVIDASAIQASGATSIDSVLQTMTATGGAMTNPGINNGSQGNASINLRGLGSQRTLVLVNSRRMVNSGTGAASTVDLNTIPVSMIKRIEVLKDGASAVYGSDAIAGVVNIILKDDFEGFELNAQSGASTQGDATTTSIDLTVGGNFDRGNAVMGIQYMDRGDASMADRDFSACPYAESTDDNGNMSLYCAGSVLTPYGHVYGPNGESLQGNADGTWHNFTDSDRYNYAAESYLYTPMQRLNMTALANYELTDTLNFFGEAMYAKRWSEQQMAPQPIWTDFTYTEAMGDSLISSGINYDDTVTYYRRMSDVGNREFSQVVDTVRVVTGIEGEFGDSWSWDVAVNYGRNDSVDRLANLINMGSVNDDIADGTFNPLDQTAWSGENMQGYTYTEINSGGSEMFILSANIGGELFELPAGMVGFAGGIEQRTEKAWFIPDSLTAQGLANDPKVDPTSGEYDVTEAYAEFVIPVLSDMFLAENVEISAAVRAFDYSTFGSDSTWKLGLTWGVTEDLMLRSVASTAFRAPTVDELYSGQSTSFDQVTFPGAQDQAQVTVGGNENLTPEEAKTLTAGFVYSPSWFDGLSVTADYYNIKIDNAIAEVNAQYIVDSCLDSSGNATNMSSALCQSAQISMDNTGRISFNNQLQNIGSEKTSGIDLNVAYNFEMLGLDWRAAADSTVLLDYEVTTTEGTVDYAGFITSGIGSFSKYKTNLDLSVMADDWSANYQARLIAGMDSFDCKDDTSACYAPSVGTVVYHDISASYFMTENLTFSAGINNLFDKTPPYYSGNNDSNTDPYTYDTLGRRFYVQASLKM